MHGAPRPASGGVVHVPDPGTCSTPHEPCSPYAARPWLSSYPPGVPADFEYPKVPLTQLLDDAAASFPRRAAISFRGTTLSYQELRDAVDHLATGLAGLGVGKGDRVSLVLPNCPQAVLTVFAALRLGAVVVPHGSLSTAPELRSQLRDCGAEVVVCLDRAYPAVAEVRGETALEHVVVTSLADYLPARARWRLRLPTSAARRSRDELTAALPARAPVLRFLDLLKTPVPAGQTPVEPEVDPAVLQYTAGTTGPARAAVLTHANLVSNAYVNRLWDTGAVAGEEVTLAVLPLFHVYGLTVCLNATVLLGGTVVLVPRFDVDEVLAVIERERPTIFPAMPPVYEALATSPQASEHDLSSLRVCVSGGMALPPEVQQGFERVSGAVLVEGYGLTESSPSTHCNPLSDRRRSSSIGLPLPGTDCKVVDPHDASREVPVGEAGELLVRGPQVFRGYWGGQVPRVLTDDGFLLTGDLAVMDQDGFFTVVGRKKDVIVTGGFNTCPSEVEEVLLRLPSVRDAAVVGVPDPRLGESVAAFLVPEPGASLTESEVVAHCRRELSSYKVPRTVQFRDELPRTAVGKVLRRVLAEEAASRAARSPDGARKSMPPSGRSA
jgi:long-chain acyl-CoA synthetase